MAIRSSATINIEFAKTFSGEIEGKFFRLFPDTATSPICFNTGISIRLDLNPDRLLYLKNPRAELKIDATQAGGEVERKALSEIATVQ